MPYLLSSEALKVPERLIVLVELVMVGHRAHGLFLTYPTLNPLKFLEVDLIVGLKQVILH